MLKMESRAKVFNAVSKEREYQNTKWGDHDQRLSIADWVVFMERHLNQAKAALYNLTPEEALGEVRKVTALGVACMENKGVVERKDG